MKKLFMVALLMAFSTSVLALDACYTGSWASPDRDGEGITIDVLDDGRTLSYFYTFGTEGRAWYLMLGAEDNRLSMYTAKMTSGEPFGAITHNVGDATITPIDGDTIRFTYDLELDIDRENASIPWCLNSLCEGDYEYTRLYGAGACG